jgi:single-strand DNA-binding protein
MSRLRNKVTLIGRLGQDPVVRKLESGQSVANFSMATSERYKDKQGETVEKTEWHNIVAWGKLSEIVEKYVKKGDEIAIEGKLTTEKYEKDGVDRFVTKIVANEMLMLGGKNEGTASAPGLATKEGDDDLPF